MVERPPRLSWIALFAVLLGIGCPVRAELQYSLTVGTLAGVSDNPRAQPDDSSAGVHELLGGRGHIDIAHLGRLTTERLGYGIVATRWIGDAGSSVLAHTLRLSSEIEPSAEVRITLHGGAVLTRMSMLDATAPSDPQTAGARPAGDQQFVTVAAGEAISWQPSGAWRVGQSLEGRFYRPLDVADSAVVDNKGATLDANIDRVWARDFAGLRGRLGAVWIGGSGSTDGTTGMPNHSEFVQGELAWRHDWNDEITHRLSGGVFVLWTDQRRVLPAGAASLAWRGLQHETELRAQYSASSSIFLGTVYERSLVGLTLGLPLDRSRRLGTFAAADFERASTLGASAGGGGTANIWFVRCGLRWQPGDYLSFGLEYWFRDQRPVATDSTSSVFPTVRQQMAMLTADVQYPPRGYYR